MLRAILIFLIGVLVGANVVYFLVRTQGLGCGDEVSRSPAVLPRAVPPAHDGRVGVPSGAVPPTPSGPITVAPGASLLVPVQGIPASALLDTYTQSRGEGRLHDAIDIMAPAGTPVLAADDGVIARLFSSERGGITLYQYDPQQRRIYYYAHLQGYAPGLAEGQALRRGQVIGYVGSTGNASPDGPHLHFAVHDLAPGDSWSSGTPVNPYPLLAGAPRAR